MTVSVAINGMSEINARANATFVNNGASTLSYDSDILVSQDVRGTGSFAVTQGASLVFLAAVGPGLTVSVSNTTVFGSGRLIIDNPNEFHGAVLLESGTDRGGLCLGDDHHAGRMGVRTEGGKRRASGGWPSWLWQRKPRNGPAGGSGSATGGQGDRRRQDTSRGRAARLDALAGVSRHWGSERF